MTQPRAPAEALGGKDNDGDADAQGMDFYDSDDEAIRSFGRRADAADSNAIVALFKGYYAAGAHDDGRLACKLMNPVLVETIVEAYGRQPGTRGETCGAVMAKLLARHRAQMSSERSFAVASVRVQGDRGYAMLGPPGARPLRYLSVHEANGRWTVNVLSDSSLP